MGLLDWALGGWVGLLSEQVLLYISAPTVDLSDLDKAAVLIREGCCFLRVDEGMKEKALLNGGMELTYVLQ